MSVTSWGNVAFGGLFAGMVVLFVALMFVRDRRQFRRMIVAGLLLVLGSIGFFWCLVILTLPDRPAPG
jgi:hypothetical protein